MASCSSGCRTARSSPSTPGRWPTPRVVDDLWTQFECHGVDGAPPGRRRATRSPAEVAEEIDRRLGAGEFRLEGYRASG